METKVHFSSASVEWSTPQALFDQLNQEFQFTLDPCASDQNHKCDKWYTAEQDGLKQQWDGERIFCNPPYGRDLPKWVKKCHDESRHATIVMLIPARTDTSYFHDYIYHKAEIRFIRGRLKFGESKTSAPFPSMVVIYNYNNQNN